MKKLLLHLCIISNALCFTISAQPFFFSATSRQKKIYSLLAITGTLIGGYLYFKNKRSKNKDSSNKTPENTNTKNPDYKYYPDIKYKIFARNKILYKTIDISQLPVEQICITIKHRAARDIILYITSSYNEEQTLYRLQGITTSQYYAENIHYKKYLVPKFETIHSEETISLNKAAIKNYQNSYENILLHHTIISFDDKNFLNISNEESDIYKNLDLITTESKKDSRTDILITGKNIEDTIEMQKNIYINLQSAIRNPLCFHIFFKINNKIVLLESDIKSKEFTEIRFFEKNSEGNYNFL